MAAFLTDSFSRAEGADVSSGVGESGNAWLYHSSWPGANPINKGRILSNTPGNFSILYNDAVPPSADYSVRCVVYCANPNGSMGILARMDEATNAWYWARLSNSNLELYAGVGGLGVNGVSPVPDSWNTIELICDGDQISVRWNGVTVLGPFTNASFAAAEHVGISNYGQTYPTFGTLHDEIQAYPLSDPLTAGKVRIRRNVPRTLIVECEAPALGVEPFTYQFQRAPNIAGAPGTWTNVGTNTAARTYTDAALTKGSSFWYRCVITDGAAATATTAAVKGQAAKVQVLCVGNSLTAGYGLLDPVNDSYPGQLQTIAGDEYFVKNLGVNSQTTAAEITAYPTLVPPLIDAGLDANLLIQWEITNDLFFGATAAAAYNNVHSYANLSEADGLITILGTCLPRSEIGVPVDFEAKRQTVNDSIRANYGVIAHGVLDVARDSRIGDLGDETSTVYYQGDNIHLNAAGAGVVASRAAGLIDNLSVTSNLPTVDAPPTAAAYFDCYLNGVPVDGVTLNYQLIDPPDGYNQTFDLSEQETPESDSLGRITMQLLRNSVYDFWRSEDRKYRVAIGNVAETILPQIL